MVLAPAAACPPCTVELGQCWSTLHLVAAGGVGLLLGGAFLASLLALCGLLTFCWARLARALAFRQVHYDEARRGAERRLALYQA